MSLQQHAFKILRSTLREVESFLDDPTTTEIMINGPNDVWVERSGVIEAHPEVDMPAITIAAAIQSLVTANGKNLIRGTSSGIVDGEFTSADGKQKFRIAACAAPISLRGDIICIRKQSSRTFSLEEIAGKGNFSPVPRRKFHDSLIAPSDVDTRIGGLNLIRFFKWAVNNQKTFLVSGQTGAGKTTFVKSLIHCIPRHERLVIIEDTPELVVSVPNYVSLQSNAQQQVFAKDLVKLSMRLRPDRVLIGELRDETAYTFLEVLNTGHPGGIATLHANDAFEGLARIEDLAKEHPSTRNTPEISLRRKVSKFIDYVVHICKDGEMRGVVEEIVEVLGLNDQGLYDTRRIYQRFAD